MQVYHATLRTGISRTREFERKGLASFAVNPGTKCGHGCTYCSTGAILRMHPSFSAVGRSAFDDGFAIVDPQTPDRVAQDARRLRHRGMIQLSTTVDAWAPEAQTHNIGRRCLEAILQQPGWTVRILTKNASVERDFDLIEPYRDRVLVGLSITTPGRTSLIASTLEPYASPIEERVRVLRQAHARGLRTYGMFCPLLPGIADSREDVDELIALAAECRAEEVFIEPVNARGSSLRKTEAALRHAGYAAAADAVAQIRHTASWSDYVHRLICVVQEAVRRRLHPSKLRILLYSSRLLAAHRTQLEHNDDGIIWLGRSA